MAEAKMPNVEKSSELSQAAILYLDLLKRSLTNTIFGQEPDANQEDTIRYVSGAIQHYQKSAAVSMLPISRMDNITTCVSDVIRNNVPGDFVETGVWRGGATIFMRALLKVFMETNRRVWVCDSFEGLPKPDPEKYPIEAKAFSSAAMTSHYNHFAVSLEEVEDNFRAYGMLDGQVKFVKGWFKDTLPVAPIDRLAIMRLDGDYYESTRDALVNLYDKLSPGGYVIIDDYGEDSWTYCRKAVEDFREERGISDPITRVDRPCCFWQKSR